VHGAFVLNDDTHADEELHERLLIAIESKDVKAATAAALNLLEHTKEQMHSGAGPSPPPSDTNATPPPPSSLASCEPSGRTRP
jgi:hypothetical protein